MGSPQHAPVRRHTGLVVPHKANRLQRMAARLVFLLIRGLALTLRFRVPAEAGLFQKPGTERMIFAIWHNRLALSLIIYNRYVRRHDPERRMAAIVSASRDGGLLAHILALFGVQPVRGSTSRRGPQALRELTTCAERGLDLPITPDGPRGPLYVVQHGVVSLSQLTGLPILPVSCVVQPKIQLNSWDRFQIPVPFASCEVRVGELVRVPREAGEAEREKIREALEATIVKLSQEQ